MRHSATSATAPPGTAAAGFDALEDAHATSATSATRDIGTAAAGFDALVAVRGRQTATRDRRPAGFGAPSPGS